MNVSRDVFIEWVLELGISLLMWALRPGLYMSSRLGDSGEMVRQAGVMSQFTIPWHAVTKFNGKDIGSISRKRCLKRSQNGKIKKEKFIVKGTVPLSSREGLDCTGHPTNFRLTSLHQHTLLRASRESSQNSNSL